MRTDWTVAGTGDFNGDGRDDVLWRHDNGAVTDWLGQANGGFVSNLPIAIVAAPTSWNVAGTGDFNGDGRDDILWRNDVGAMSPIGSARPMAASSRTPNAAYQLPTNWQIAGTGDFNGDGRDDIMWRNENGAYAPTGSARRMAPSSRTSRTPAYQLSGPTGNVASHRRL